MGDRKEYRRQYYLSNPEKFKQYFRDKYAKMTKKDREKRKIANIISANPLIRACIGCKYLMVEGIPSCGYILFKAARRPCPPGEGCTVKKERKKKNRE